MTSLRPEHRATAVSTLASALTGAVLLFLLGFDWPRPIIDWMRVRVIRSDGPMPPDIMLKVAGAFLVVVLVLAVVVLVTRWLLRRLGVTRPAAVLASVLFLAFTLSFAFEAVSQVMRAWGNLTASDSTGFLFEDGQLTAHGWETIARRASAAALYAAIMLAAFAATLSVATRPLSRTSSTTM